jgi:hypothetical protein
MQINNPQPAKLLVRHISLNKYLGPAGRWVERAELALNFAHPLSAINACLGRGLENVELILGFDGARPDLHVRLDAIQ